MNKDLYNYKAKLLRVIDGDTIEVTIDLGFDISINQIVRIARIDTPEIRTSNALEKEAGITIRNYVETILTFKTFNISTIKGSSSDKYGRYLAEIYVEDENDHPFSLSSRLISLGFAHVYDGKAKEIWSDEELVKIINQ